MTSKTLHLGHFICFGKFFAHFIKVSHYLSEMTKCLIVNLDIYEIKVSFSVDVVLLLSISFMRNLVFMRHAIIDSLIISGIFILWLFCISAFKKIKSVV